MPDAYEQGGQGNWGDPQLALALANAVRRTVDKKAPGGEAFNAPTVMLRYATVAQASPLLIALGGDPTTQSARYLSSYSPTLNDTVAVLQPTEGQLLVIGKVL